MFTTKKTVTIVALALAGALSVGAVAAQAQSGAASHSDSRTPATSVSSIPAGDDNGLRGDGTVDDYVSTAVTPTTTSAPAPSTGLPTDADHPQGDNTVGPGDTEHAGEEVGEDVGETNEVSDVGVSDDAAGHDVSDNHGAKSGDNAGHDSGDSAENGDSGH